MSNMIDLDGNDNDSVDVGSTIVTGIYVAGVELNATDNTMLPEVNVSQESQDTANEKISVPDRSTPLN